MSQNQKRKILVCGDTKGQLNELFERVDSIQKSKGAFDALFCVGKFFNDTNNLAPYKNGEKTVPIPTYFIITHQEKGLLEVGDEGGLICKNLTFLGAQGIKDIKELRVGYVSATHHPTKKTRPKDYTPAAITAMLDQVKHNQFKGIDILLSNEWPKGLLNSLSDEFCPKGISMLEYDDFGADVVAQVASSVSPRYHFTSSPSKKIFFERCPYRNGPQFAGQRNFAVTRFYSLGEAFNTKKHRFLYAFSIQPLHGMDSTELYEQPPHTTDFPLLKYCYIAPEEPKPKRQKLAPNDPDLEKARFDRTFMDSDSNKPNYAQNRRKSSGANKQNQTHLTTGARGEQCWFCMSTSVFEYHLIVSVAKNLYLAVAKGGINDAHMLIVPIKHLPNQLVLPGETRDELNKWISSLQNFFAARGEEMVLFEHNYPAPNQHLHIQVIPVPSRDKSRVKEMFTNEGKREKVDWIVLKPEDSLTKQVDGAYFWVRLPDGTQMVAQLDNKIPFSFGRRVLASVLGHPEWEDWKACVQAKLIEEKITKSLRDEFKKYSI